MLKDSKVTALCSDLIKALQRERLRQKLSMNALAERAGLSQQMVSYVERGLRKPTLDTIIRITLALEVDLGSMVLEVMKKR